MVECLPSKQVVVDSNSTIRSVHFIYNLSYGCSMTKRAKKQAVQEDPNIYWMIRKKGTNLYSRGGVSSRHIWAKQGKIWSSQARLLAHFRALEQARKWELGNGRKPSEHPYKDAEVVQFRRIEESSLPCEGYGE